MRDLPLENMLLYHKHERERSCSSPESYRRRSFFAAGAQGEGHPDPAAECGTRMVKKAEELVKKNGWFLARQFENLANPD